MSEPFDAANRALARSFKQTKEMVGDDNPTVALRIPAAQFVALLYDELGRLNGIAASGQGNYVEVRLDRAQLQALRDQLTAEMTK